MFHRHTFGDAHRPRIHLHRLQRHRSPSWRILLWLAFIPLIILNSLLVNLSTFTPTTLAAPAASYSAPGHNTLQQFQQLGQQSKANQGAFQRPGTDPGVLKPKTNVATTKPLPGIESPKMHDQTFTLDDSFVLNRPKMAASSTGPAIKGTSIPAGTGPLVIKGDDGRLEVDMTRGSLDFAHAALAGGGAPVGQLLLRIHQLSGHYIEADSILGTYQIQVVDSQGNAVAGVALKKPLTIIYHYQPWELQDLNLDPNQIHLAWTDLLSAARTAGQSSHALTANATTQTTAGLVVPMTNDAKAQTLTARTTVLGSVMTASGTPEIAAPTTPDLFEASGNSGQYNYSYPITVAPGPDGFEPQLNLVYSSQSTNGRHSRRAPAGDEGEGFSLSLGSITAAQYPSSSTGGAATWYSINGVDGVSDKLVPFPNKANYYETEHLSHLLVQWTGSCWRVWGQEGSFFTLGCTPDSVQKSTAGPYEWDLNEVLAPYNDPHQVKTMLISYVQDTLASQNNAVRDFGIKQIKYGYATTVNASSLSLVSGTVDFSYYLPNASSSLSPFAVPYPSSYYTPCNPPTITHYRCDDPGTVGSISSPGVMSTMTLNSITSYVGTDTTGQKAYNYTFTYQDTPYTTNYFDPFTQVQQAAAGEHLLTQITPTMYVQGVAKPRKGIVFNYATNLRDSYYDPNVFAQGSTTTHFSGQTFWSYLTHYEDLTTGEGANISYATARGNMSGTPYITDSQGQVIDDRFDPLYCANNANNSDASKQCTGNYAHPDTDSWSIQVVTQISALGTDSSGNTTVATTSYHYSLSQVNASNLPVGCNPITGTGVPPQEADCVADNWAPGFNGTVQHDGDWADYYHAEFRGFSIVYITSPSNDLTVDYYFASEGWWTPESDGSNYNGGQLYREDVYQGNSPTADALLRETLNSFSGVSGPYPNNSCDGNASKIYAPCVAAVLETKTTFFEGGAASDAPWIDTKYTYDDMAANGSYVSSGYHNLTQEVISGSNLNTSVYPITKKWTYAVTDQEGGPTYYTVDKVTHSEIDDASGHVWACQDTTYDEGRPSGIPTPDAGLATTVKSYSTCGNSSTALTSYTAYDQYGNAVATVDPLGSANPGLYSSHGCSASGVVDLSSSWTAGHFTSCTVYDTTTAGLPVGQTNALGQTSSLSYDYTSMAQLSSSTDANNQSTSYSYSYDSNGNKTISVKAPGESGSYTTRQDENSNCTASSALPCYEIDSNNVLYGNAISRTFYDAQGRAVETRTPGPTPGDDTIVMTVYNDQNHTRWQSEPFQVSSGAGWIDPTGAKDVNGNAPAGTTTFYDALGRVLAIQDPNYGSAQEPGLFCSWGHSGSYTSCTNYSTTGGSSSMEETSSIDANGHEIQRQMDALGHTIYVNTYSGALQNVVEQQTQTRYNALDKPTSMTVIDKHPQSGQSITSVTTTMSYDDQGRLLTLNDPDRGSFSYSYDPDGNLLAAVQTSGSNTRTLGYNYDLLGRLGCEQTAAPTINWNGACSAGNSLLQNAYDTTFMGVKGTTDFPVGHLTQSVATTYYPDSTSATVTQQVQTDPRGRTVAAQMQLGLPSAWNVSSLPTYQMTQAYNDANQPTTTGLTAIGASYSFTQVYDGTNGTLQGLANNGNATANLAQLAYNEFAQLGGLTLLNGAASSPASIVSETFNYDANLRPTSLTANWLSGSGNSGQVLSQGRSYDNASNVTSVSTTMATVSGQNGSGGSETQNFCYDEQNRLVWAGNSGTQPGAGNGTCGSGTLATSFSGGSYNTGFTYNNLGQIWQGPLNGQGAAVQYLYCNSSSSAPHQLTGVYPGGTTCANKGSATALYSASYDPWGNQSSRTYNSVTSTLSYDALNRLVNWQGANGASEQTVYDATGERVLTRATSAGTTKLTVYAFGLQELFYTGAGALSSQTDYYSVAGHLVGSTNGTTTTYYLTDAQGSLLTSLSSTTITGEQLYAPYGTTRYQAGTLGTAKAFTGQEADALTGLYYYHARYYDPVVGMFLSADVKQGNQQGMNPYAYVGNNPETRTDPTGQMLTCGNGCGLSGSGGDGEPVGGKRPNPGGATDLGNCQENPSACRSGPPPAGKSNSKPTPTPTPTPTDGKNHECHHSAAQCAQGERNRDNQNADKTGLIKWLQLLAAGWGLIWDFKALADEKFSLSDAVKFWSTLVNLVGDVSTVISAIASIVGSGLFQEIAGVVATVANVVKAIYHAAMSSWWVTGALIAGYYVIQTTFLSDAFIIDQETNALVALAGTAIGKAIGKDKLDANALGTSLIQVGINALQTQIQMNNDSPVDNFI